MIDKVCDEPRRYLFILALKADKYTHRNPQREINMEEKCLVQDSISTKAKIEFRQTIHIHIGFNSYIGTNICLVGHLFVVCLNVCERDLCMYGVKGTESNKGISLKSKDQ